MFYDNWLLVQVLVTGYWLGVLFTVYWLLVTVYWLVLGLVLCFMITDSWIRLLVTG